MVRTKKLLALTVAMVLLVSCLMAAVAEEREVRIASQPSCAFLPQILAQQLGWMDEAMAEIGVKVVWTDFEAGPPMNESFAAGQQDIGVIGDVPAVSAVVAGQKNVYIASFNGGATCAMLVRDDSGIETVADMKGKKLGLTVGSTGQNMAQKLLASAGLDISTDVELINVSMGEAQIVLVNNNVDAVVVWEPNISRLEALDGVHILEDGVACGFSGMNVAFARKEFVDQNPDIVKVYLEQSWRAAKAYEEDPDAYIDLLAEYYSLDAALVKQATSKYNYALAFSEEDIAGMQDTVTFLMGIGAIFDEIDVTQYIVNDLAQQVIAEAEAAA